MSLPAAGMETSSIVRPMMELLSTTGLVMELMVMSRENCEEKEVLSVAVTMGE